MSLLTRFHRSKCGQRARASRRATTAAGTYRTPATRTVDTHGRSTPRARPFSHNLGRRQKFAVTGDVWRRLGAAPGLRRGRLAEPPDRDAEPLGLVGEIGLDAGTREDDDADWHGIKHLIVALERCGLGVAGPIGLEGDLPDLTAVGPAGGG